MTIAIGTDEQTIAWPRWVGRTFLGWSAGLVLGIALIVGVESLGVQEVQFPIVIGMGLGVGFFQARVLRVILGATRLWIVATTFGLSAPFLASDLLRFLGVAMPFSLVGYVALGGLIAAALQWRQLRTRTVRAAWWPAMSALGWLLGASTVWIAELLPRTPGLIGALLYLTVVLSGGLVLGATGAVAWRRIQRSDHG